MKFALHLLTKSKIKDSFLMHKPSIIRYTFIILSALSLACCNSRPTTVPTTFAESNDSVVIYPDYRDITIPPNIAPLNFMVVDESASEFVVKMGDLVCGATADGKLDIDTTAWRSLLAQYTGKDLEVHIYAHRPSGWIHPQPLRWHVAEEPIDSFLSYRLIEPGYELYRQLGLYQRNLTNFTENVIYENNREYDEENNHCVNCHNYQNYSTDHMLFHVRASHGGTIIIDGTEAHKIAIKHDSIISAGVYPSWHPTQPLIAFSTNFTGQVFHMFHPEKIEVLDMSSDLLLYDVEHNSVRHIVRSSDALETFPCWSPDGRRLYYCSARCQQSMADSTNINIVMRYDSLYYDIYSMSFDPVTREFGEPRLEVNASAMHKSTSVPRISPDGRYLLFALGNYGQFHIWHKSADLWVKSLSPTPDLSQQGGEKADALSANEKEAQSLHAETDKALYPLTEANSPEADSYHTWSSNGRWIVFASRREDAAYSRAFIAYFDREGHAHRAFLLPQRDPEHNIRLLKSYNVPELTRNAVKVSTSSLNHTVYHTDAEMAKYEE